MEQALENFFKPEVRKSGSDYLKKNAVVLSMGSDTLIEGYIKGTATARVSLRAKSIEDELFTADCSCSAAAKGQLCKHIWAMLLQVEIKYPDFLSSKKNIEKSRQENPKKSAFKAKQNEYKKLQYQKQKLRTQAIKAEKKKAKHVKVLPDLPEEVVQALLFFAENGFPLEIPIETEALKNAKKKLSRVFHPDIGGSHQESVDLNVNYDILVRFMEI